MIHSAESTRTDVTTTAGCRRAPTPRRRPDGDCRAHAGEFLNALIGAPPDDLSWDDTNRLEGHAHLGGRELIVIAGRDATHQPIVLTVEDWGYVRLECCNRGALLAECAITDRLRLAAALAA